MIPDNCRFTNDHEWLMPDGPDHYKVGITDFATGQLGDIVFVELPAPGAKLAAGATFGSVEAVKTVSDLFSPVGGEVVEVNPAVQSDPGVVNRSPFDEGWMIRIRVSNPAEIEALLTPKAYEELVAGLEGGH